MRRNINRLNIVIAAALLMPAAAFAQVDTSDWNCEYCPFDDGYRADIDVGAGYVSEDAVRFGNGSGYDEKGAHAILSGDGRYLKDGTEMTWYAENLGLDSRAVGISAGKPGKFDLGLTYREIPYRLFGSTSTIFTRSESDTLSLPSGWVAAGSTSGFTALDSSLMSQNIEKDRSVLEFGSKFMPGENIKLYANYRRQQRDGVSIMTGSRFTQSAYLPRPVDDYTDQIDAGLRYSSGAFNISLAYFASFYRNEVESLTWDNPFTSMAGTERGRLSLEPDNDFQQISVSGVYRVATYNTVIAFSAASGRGEQDVDFLPYTISPVLVTPALPRTSLDGQVDTSNYALTITAKPHRLANIKVAYRFDERDNQTPVSMWSRVITDTFPTSANEENVPYSFERSRLNLSASLRLFDTVKVSGGYDRTDLDRDHQEVAEQSEDTGWGKVRWRPTSYLEASFRGGASRREIDEYDTDVAISLGQNPLLRKYNLAYRYREFGELSLLASLPEKPVSIGMTYLFADDSYTESELGITESEEARFTVDFSWAVSENASVYLTAGNESIDAIQVGNDVADWQASHDDDFTHYGGGFRLAGISDKIDLTLDYTRSEGETEILYAGQNVATDSLPELTSEMDSLRLSLNYNLSERFDVNFALRYEQFETADWALDGVEPDTIPGILTMGADAWDYDVWVVGIGFRYRVQ
jgi:MtrB/PioB family decaheme-associated outer membrane protein